MNDEYIKIVKKFDVFSEGIKCLLCGEYSIAKLLFNKIERSNQEIEFFRKIDVFLDDNRSNFDLESSEITKIRWMFECFAFGLIQKHNDFSIDCALITFSQSNDYVTAIFKPFLLDLYPIPKMSDHLANEFAKALFNFYAKYTSMFRILKPFFHSMIVEVNDNRLFKLLNHSAYYLYQNIPVKYLSIDNFQNKEIKNIIYYTQNTKELLTFQTDFSNKFFYPNEFPVSFNSSACSMALSSIHLGVHFVDLFSQLIKEKIEKVDLDTIPNIAKVIPEFVPFLFAAYQPLIYRFPNKYLRLISAELPILNEFSFKIKELQHRFISDIIIQKLYEKLNNIDISIDCFSKNSIPYHFYGFYDQIVCNSFENRSFYIYSDHEKNCDYDFLHSYYAINEFIILIGSNSHESRRSMIQKHFDNIEKHMKMIKNDFTRQITSTDLFSLIFLRDSNNSFLCHPAFALILIKLLRNLSPNDQFLLKSEFIMSQNYTDNKSIDITSYFTGNLTNLLELLGQKKWDIADHMTKYSSKKFRHIFLLSRSIELHSSSQACLFDCSEVQSMLNIELLLTNNNLCKNHMKSICNCSIKNSNDFINRNSPFLATMNDNLKIILENRLKIESKYIFSPYTSFMWKDTELIARSFDTNPLNFIYSRKIQQFTEKLPTNSSFMDFLKYISRYFWSYNHDTTNKVIKLDAIGVISHLFNQNKIKKAEKMATLFNMNLFYVAMNHQKQFNFSSESVNYYKTKYPLECLEICYKQFPGDTDLKGLNPFIIKFFKNSTQNISYENIPKNIIPISRSKSNDVLMKENIKRSISKSDQMNYHFAPLFFSNKKQKIKSVPSKLSTNPKRNNTLREYFHMHLPNYKNRKTIYQQNTEKSNFQKTYKNEQKRNDVLFLKFILNHNIDDLKIIDDFIYIIDHIEASTILLDNLSKVRDDVALYILDIIGYSSNILQNEKVKLLYLKNDIKKYAHGCEGDYSIVNRLITSEHCELASNYIEQFVQCKNDIILKNVEFFLFHDKVKLSIFLRHISDYFELIASELYETIPILANLCPDSIKPYFYAYASLPKPIQKISSLLNKSSVTKAICTSNLDLIINLEKKHLILFSENNLVEILEESAKYKTFNNFIKDSIHLSTLVHDNDIFKQINSKIVNEKIFKIKVDSIESEFNALLHIEKIQRFESVCPLFYDTSQILESYHGLLYRTPFFSTGIPYSLSENLDVICLKLDLDDIAYTFPSVNQIKYTEQRCKILISLGRFEESINFLSCHNFTIEMDETFLIPLIYKEVFNFEALSMMYQNGIEGFNNNNVCEPAQMPFYKTIVSNCRSKKKKLNLLPFCLDFCEKFATKETFFGISIRYGNLNDTIDRLLSIQNISEQIDLFIYRIVSNAIAYNKLQYLQNELSEKTFWASLLNFCTDKKMSILALDLRLLLNQKEELALAYIDIFGETKNTSKQLVYIGSAMNILVELIKEREKALLNHEKVLSTTNIEKITDLFILSTLQYDICTFFYEERINFSQNMNLFHDKKSSFEIGNALIQNNQMWLLKRVSEVMQIPEKDIVKYSFQKITDHDAKIVCNLVESTQSEKRFWTSYRHMFLNILSLSKNYELIPLIISSIIPVKDFPYILYEFDFLSQALSTINSQKTSYDLLPAIAARASILGDVELIYICNDQVSNLLEK